MESDQRYYWRRANEELCAAARAVTPAARQRRHQLVETYVEKLGAIPQGCRADPLFAWLTDKR